MNGRDRQLFLCSCYLLAVVTVRSVSATVPIFVRSVSATVPAMIMLVVMMMGMRMMMVAYVAGIAAIADDAIIAAITDEATKCKCLVYNKRT